MEVANLPQHLLESFQADVGRSVEIELTKEKVTGEVREVTAAGIKVSQMVRQGQGTAKLGRTIALRELSVPERLRRLGAGDTPELNLQRGLLALEAGRPDHARKLFEAAGGPLGAALLAQIEAQRAEAPVFAKEAHAGARRDEGALPTSRSTTPPGSANAVGVGEAHTALVTAATARRP